MGAASSKLAAVSLHLRDTCGSSRACELDLEPIRDELGAITPWLAVRQVV